jgi:hypothetical protein
MVWRCVDSGALRGEAIAQLRETSAGATIVTIGQDLKDMDTLARIWPEERIVQVTPMTLVFSLTVRHDLLDAAGGGDRCLGTAGATGRRRAASRGREGPEGTANGRGRDDGGQDDPLHSDLPETIITCAHPPTDVPRSTPLRGLPRSVDTLSTG